MRLFEKLDVMLSKNQELLDQMERMFAKVRIIMPLSKDVQRDGHLENV